MHTPHVTLHGSSGSTSVSASSSTLSVPSDPLASTDPTTAHVAHASRASQHGYDAGLLTLRLVLGLAMAAHGTQKLFGWFGGHGLDGTAQGFTAMGYPAGRAMAVVAGLCETLGGLGLAVGLLTPLAGAAVLGTMVNAFTVTWDGGFFAPEGVEYAVVLAAGAACLTLSGPGRYAADQLLPVLRDHRLAHGLAALVLALVTACAVLLTRA